MRSVAGVYQSVGLEPYAPAQFVAVGDVEFHARALYDLELCLGPPPFVNERRRSGW